MADVTKQELLISYLLSSPELFIKSAPIVRSEYFDPKLKSTVAFIQSYFERYRAAPSPEQVKAETKREIGLKPELKQQELKYAEDQLEQFCRESAIEHAILSSPALVAEGKYDEIQRMLRDAITVSLNRNLGLNYFEDPEARLRYLLTLGAPIPTNMERLDHYLGGGLNRKEMIIFAAPPGVGKSLTMSNVARNLIAQGLSGVYITLELSEEVVAKRFDSMFTGVAQSEVLRNITKISIDLKDQSVKSGKLFIKRFPESSTNANHIRAYLKEFEIENGFTPDFIVVDYLDLMCSNQAISAENTFARDKFISEELRAIAHDYNLIMITASQLNRSAQLLESIEELSQAHIAGGISKANTTDNMVAIIQNPTMKARGEMMFKLLKTRSSGGVGFHFMMRFDPITLLLSDMLQDEDRNPTNKTISSYVRGRVAGNAQDKVEELKRANSLSSPSSQTSKKLDVNKLPFQI